MAKMHSPYGEVTDVSLNTKEDFENALKFARLRGQLKLLQAMKEGWDAAIEFARPMLAMPPGPIGCPYDTEITKLEAEIAAGQHGLQEREDHGLRGDK